MRRFLILFFIAVWIACSLLAQSAHEKRVQPVASDQRQAFEKQPKIAVLVGIGAYPEGSGLSTLQYAANDVRELAAELEKGGYAVRQLVDAHATRGVIVRTLNQLGEMLDPDQGTFLFYFSGHGFTQGGKNYLAAYGAAVDDLQREGLPLDEVEQLLKRRRARRQVLWIDACRNDPRTAVRDASRRTFAGLAAAEGLRELYATRPGGVSYEDDGFRHGVFTYYLLRGLRGEAAGADSLVTFQDLAGYLTDAMIGYSVKSGRAQRPFDLGEASGDFLIAKVAGGVVTPQPQPEQRGTKVNPKDGLTYVWIPPGTFTMGCSRGDSECQEDEKPAHRVAITKGFWMGQTEVTQEAYQRVIGRNPSHFQGARLPVETVSWDEAQAYCRAMGMRLPTEAEWEYAARGGDASSRYGGLRAVAWYDGNSGNQAHEVARKQSNHFGLYDMLGNVWEWVADWYADYSAGAATDPRGASNGIYRVLRGGCWNVSRRLVRASFRHSFKPEGRYSSFGFRCAGD
jgi:formylglycine-generating enzyme required for sulfatase activity